MGEGLRWDVWLVVLNLLKIVSTTNGQDKLCAELEFEGLNSEDKLINATENSFINLTFHLKTAGCQPLVDTFQVKISYQEKSLVTDMCNVFFHPHCNVTNSSSPCRCLDSCCAQLFMKVSPSDSRVYTWTWFSHKDRDKKEQRDIGIHVIARRTERSPLCIVLPRRGRTTNKCRMVYPVHEGPSNTSDYQMVIILSSVCLVIVGNSVAICIFWRRTKAKADVTVDDNEVYSSEFDSLSDNFVNIENGQSSEETYDHLSTYRDVSH